MCFEKLLKFLRKERGQAFVELGLVLLVLVVLTFGTIELARVISLHIRMANVAREVARMMNAQEYNPDEMINTFIVMTNIAQPANFENEGRVIISVIQRVPGSRTDLFISPPANTNQDYLIITDRYYYPYSGTDVRTPEPNGLTNWASQLPTTFDNGLTNPSYRLYIPFSNNVGPISIDMLSGMDKTAAVEIFHTNNIAVPIGIFKTPLPSYLYDFAAF